MGATPSVIKIDDNLLRCTGDSCKNFALNDETYCEFCLILNNRSRIHINDCIMCIKRKNTIIMTCGHDICKCCYDLNCLAKKLSKEKIFKISDAEQFCSMYIKCKSCRMDISLKRNNIIC